MTDRSDDDNDDTEEVGYGKPPKKNRFKPGQSGNPSGGHKKRKLNALQREEKQAEKLKQQELSLRDIVTRVALEEQLVRTSRGKMKMARKEVIVRRVFDRASQPDASDKDIRQCLQLLDKAGLLVAPAPAETTGGVLVIYSPMQAAEWEAATEGQLLSIDPLEGIPGAEGIFDQPITRGRMAPDPED